MTRDSGSAPADIPLPVVVFESFLKAIKLIQEEALVDFLQSYYVAPGITFYLYISLNLFLS